MCLRTDYFTEFKQFIKNLSQYARSMKVRYNFFCYPITIIWHMLKYYQNINRTKELKKLCLNCDNFLTGIEPRCLEWEPSIIILLQSNSFKNDYILPRFHTADVYWPYWLRLYFPRKQLSCQAGTYSSRYLPKHVKNVILLVWKSSKSFNYSPLDASMFKGLYLFWQNIGWTLRPLLFFNLSQCFHRCR